MNFSLQKLFTSLKSDKGADVNKTVGIDVGSSSVKVVEIEETDRALVLKTYGEMQLGPYDGASLGDLATLKQKQRIEAIVDVVREAGVSASAGVLTIPMSVSFVTVIPVTVRENDDLASRITVEARKYIPLPLPDVALDWTELAPSGQSDPATKEVLVAAIERKTVSDYKQTLDAIGMSSQPSEIEAFSLVRGLSRADDTTIAVLDLGARTSKLYIARDGMIERIHRVSAGGAMITRRISEMQDISFEDAENRKRALQHGAPEERDIQKATTSVLDGVLQEFKRIIDQYEAREGAPIGRIVIAGGVAASPVTLPYVQDVLAHQTEVGNAFDKLAYPAFMEDALQDIAPSFAVSIGAALRYFG